MARIHDLIRQVAAHSPDLAKDIEREVAVLSERLAFGLNFERHTPEEVELPGRPVRRGDKVHVLPARGEMPKAENSLMWVVESIDSGGGSATIARLDVKGAGETWDVGLDDLVVVAEFRDPIYPGLVSTGTVERGGDKPFHSVINGENFHALQTLLFTHRGKIDAIYIDPPYNTGARDWKYNNDYVEGDDLYRHSKWLAMIERRLLLAKELLNPNGSVLIVTIDEKEYLRLGLQLEQTFPDARVQMVSIAVNPATVARTGEFSRADEFAFFVMLGSARPERVELGSDWITQRGRTHRGEIRWDLLRRSGTSGAARRDRPGLFYPIFVNESTYRIESVGEGIELSVDRATVSSPPGTFAVWPVRQDGSEGRWMIGPARLRQLLGEGLVRVGQPAGEVTPIYYLKPGEVAKIASGQYVVVGTNADGSVQTALGGTATRSLPSTQWHVPSHDSTQYGARLLRAIVPGRVFPFPKSLYAVEDALRFFLAAKPDALVLDFFAGSGTTSHAVMRLNKQDGGQRHSICVTNNEVSADEQKSLRDRGLRPGDSEWEALGICEFITKPRITAAVTGTTPDGEPIKGDYKFTDEFPMAAGFEENVEFFKLTYEAPLRVASNRDFPKVAPLLWFRAGSTGRRIESINAGWDVADAYGVLADLDKSDEFLATVANAPDVRVAFVITDEDRLFEAIVRDLPEHVEPVRMYDAYLRNFELESRVPR